MSCWERSGNLENAALPLEQKLPAGSEADVAEFDVVADGHGGVEDETRSEVDDGKATTGRAAISRLNDQLLLSGVINWHVMGL